MGKKGLSSGQIIKTKADDLNKVIEKLELNANPDLLYGMAKYGITPKKAYGIRIPVLRNLAKEIGKNHRLAGKLWKIDNRETRILASMIDMPEIVSEAQMERWVNEFDYWEICDQCVMNLFEKTDFAYKKAIEWSSRESEYVKRAGFVLMARLAVSDKKAVDSKFEKFFSYIKKEAIDERPMVKKAVNWALRQIGKRNMELNKKAINVSREIKNQNSSSAKWIAGDALRELTDKKIRQRIS